MRLIRNARVSISLFQDTSMGILQTEVHDLVKFLLYTNKKVFAVKKVFAIC
jgi:hypothetical protein